MQDAMPPSLCGRPRIQRGEAFSGWLHRLAVANGLTDHCLTQRLYADQALWTRDTDRIADQHICEVAAAATGERVEHLRDGTLHRYTGRIVSRVPLNGWLPWITPVGVYHRMRLHRGWAFCPHCLSEDRPLQIQWRLAFSVGCLKHGRSLLDACPACGAAFNYHRLVFGLGGRRGCHACGRHIGHSVPQPPLRDDALALQHVMNKVLRAGHGPAGCEDMPCIDWFASLRAILTILSPSQRSPGLLDAWDARARRRLGLIHQHERFEFQPLAHRATMLAALLPYLRDWPTRLQHDLRRANIQPSRFYPHASYPWPACIREIFGLANDSP